MIPQSAAEAATQRLEGAVNSFVRKHGATIAHVEAQFRSAVRFGATKEELLICIHRGARKPPGADPGRVQEILARFPAS